MFTKGLILTMFNPKKKIIVEIDINRIALGAILSQLDKKNRLYPVIFYFRKFTTLKLLNRQAEDVQEEHVVLCSVLAN